MRILLISSNRERHPWPVPPIGACYVASSLEAAGFEVDLLDLIFSRNPGRDITDRIDSFGPDLIGVSIRNIDNVDWRSPHFYLREVKDDVIDPVRQATSAPLVIGGSAVSIMPAQILEYMGADYAILGEGEHSFPLLAASIESGNGLERTGGILKRGAGGIPPIPVERIPDLDRLPPPQVYKWVDWEKYRYRYSPYPIQTKRGCALRCSYCVYNDIEGFDYRLRSPESIVDEIEDIIDNCSPTIIEFTDSTFNIPLDHATAVCREIIRRGVKCSFNTMGINPGGVTEELAALMKQAGFMEVSCTPESGSERMLRSLSKGFTVADVRRAARLLRSAGIPVVWYFLFGGPGENESTIRETFDFIEEHISIKDLVFITSGIRVLPGSPLHRCAVDSGSIPLDADLLHPVWYQPEGIDRERMMYLIEREVISHPNYINLQENTDTSLLARILKRMYSILGIRSPIWANIRKRDRIYRLTGHNRRRRRELERRQENGI